jgi:hypothetical protein
MRTSEFPTVILAAQGDIFKLIAADPQNAFLISAAQERATGQANLLLGYLAVMGKNFSIASLDSLLGMENIMGENGISYFPAIYYNVIYGNGPSEPPLSEKLPLIEWDLKGTPLPKELQGKVFVISP